MKKTVSFIIALVMLFSLFGAGAYAETPLPYTDTDVFGNYCDLPDPGSEANGSIILDCPIARVTLLRTRYMPDYPQYAVDLLIENKSETGFSVSGSSWAIVDGYAFDSYCYEEISAGEMEVAVFYIVADDFKYPGIMTPQDIDFNLAFFSLEDGEMLDLGFIGFSPAGISDGDVNVTPISEIGYSDFEFFDEESGCGFRVIDAKMQENGEFYQIDILLENRSDEHRVLSWKNVKVEGQAIEIYYYEGLPAGTSRVSHAYIDTLPLILEDKLSPSLIEFDFAADNFEETVLSVPLTYRPAKG